MDDAEALGEAMFDTLSGSNETKPAADALEAYRLARVTEQYAAIMLGQPGSTDPAIS